METESVRSGRSERSDARSHRSGNRHHHGERSGDRSDGGSGRRSHSSRHGGGSSRDRSHRSGGGGGHRSGRETDGDDDRSTVVGQAPIVVGRRHGGNGNGQQQQQVDVNNGYASVDNNQEIDPITGPPGAERIEVQILPQDDNWGETTTAVTGATSEFAYSMEDMSRVKDFENSIGFNCARYIGSIFAGILGFIAFLSPIAMVVLPKLGLKGDDWILEECGVKCEGLFISFGFKLLILLIGTWALFFRKPKATMPRIFIFRALILFLVFVLTFAFWLFYGVRIFNTSEENYHSIVLFSVSLVDALLFIHYLAIIMLEIRQLQPQYSIRVVRSPDGESKCYNLGQLSIQRAAVWVLEQYYRDFTVYNPYLDHIPRRTQKMNNFKFYDIDGGQNSQGGGGGGGGQNAARAVFAAAARSRDSSHNDRFYEEQEYERRVRKRKARLIVAAEESFTHIKRMQEEGGPSIPMNPVEAAQSIFPSMARALQKYLRITRQQPRYTMESILQHLANCLAHDMSPKAFLERYMMQGAVIWNDKDHRATQTWTLICEQLLSREVEDGMVFQLRQADVSLLVFVRKTPHFNLTEEVLDPNTNKFVLKLNSETSV